MALISSELKVPKESVVDYDLIFYDTQPSCLLGIQKEFISSGRLDNLASTIPLPYAMIEASKNLSDQTSINIACSFDSEEIGSQTYQGANNSYIPFLLERIFNTIQTNEKVLRIFNTNFS